MLAITASDFLLTPADSARVVANVYAVSLLATLPLIVAALAALTVRKAPAATRALVWRSAVVVLLVVYVGRYAALHWMTWIVPDALAAPLVALGRLQVSVAAYAPVSHAFGSSDPGLGMSAAMFVRALLATYLTGVLIALVPTARGLASARSPARNARSLDGGDWPALLRNAKATIGLRRRVRLLVTSRAVVPTTWGILRPVVLLPEQALHWSATHRRAVLLHELAHVRAADVVFGVAGRIACALYWFHPGVWWIARRLRAECELACDDRVLSSGVRASDYAELLAMAADTLCARGAVNGVALAMTQRAGLRARLAAVLDPRHDVAVPASKWITAAAAITLCAGAAMSSVQLSPARSLLTGLMLDTRWESRAYAVLGLAQRADSISVARAAAAGDPSPRVRAWAEYALRQNGIASTAPAALLPTR